MPQQLEVVTDELRQFTRLASSAAADGARAAIASCPPVRGSLSASLAPARYVAECAAIAAELAADAIAGIERLRDQATSAADAYQATDAAAAANLAAPRLRFAP